MRLVLEPLNRYETDIVVDIAEGLALIEAVGCPNVGLLLDTFHANIEEPSLAGTLRQAMAAGRLWHVHLGDSNRLAPGMGHIDFGAIVGTLAEIGYTGYLSAELLPKPDPDAAALATIRHMRRTFSAAIQNFKGRLSRKRALTVGARRDTENPKTHFQGRPRHEIRHRHLLLHVGHWFQVR